MPSDHNHEGDDEALVAKLVASGRYASRSEVIRSALRLLEEREAERDQRRAELLRSIDEAAVDIDESEGIPAEDVMAEMDEIIRRRAAGRDAAE